MAITLTEKAAEHVRHFLVKRGKGEGIRLGVKTSGCSGMAYVLEFVDTPNTDDLFFESFGVKDALKMAKFVAAVRKCSGSNAFP